MLCGLLLLTHRKLRSRQKIGRKQSVMLYAPVACVHMSPCIKSGCVRTAQSDKIETLGFSASASITVVRLDVRLGKYFFQQVPQGLCADPGVAPIKRRRGPLSPGASVNKLPPFTLR